MALAQSWDASLRDALRKEMQNQNAYGALVLVKRVLHDGGVHHNGSHLPLPLQCSDSGTRICRLVKLLTSVNELLYCIGAEVFEITPGRIAVRCYKSFSADFYKGQWPLTIQALTFLYCIVANHHCVDSIETRYHLCAVRRISPLLCSILDRISSLYSFSVTHSHLNVQATLATCEAITRLLRSQLAELTLNSLNLLELSYELYVSLDAFMAALSDSRTLRWLRIINVSFGSQDSHEVVYIAEKLRRALTKNTSITHLSMDASFFESRCGETVEQFLTSPTAPRILNLTFFEHDRHRKTDRLFQGLVTNKTLTMIFINEFRMDFMDSKSLSGFLAYNDTIQELKLMNGTWKFGKEDTETIRYHARHLAEGLRKTKSLRCITVPHKFTIAEIRHLAEAANHSQSLEELRFFDITGDDVEPMSAMHQEMAPNWKVAIKVLWVHADPGTAALITRFHEALTKTEKREPLNLLFAPPDHQCRRVGAKCGDHLITIHLSCRCFNNTVSLNVAKELALYLQLTNSLRELSIVFNTSEETAKIILEGIAKNKGIEYLHIEKFSVKDEDWAILTNWLTNNRHAHTLEFPRVYGKHAALVDPLSTSLENNYCVSSLNLVDVYLLRREWTHVRGMVWRNQTMLRSAAAFVLGSSHKRDASAYETLSWHPQLLMAVQREALLEKNEALQMIHQSSRRIRNHENFWRLSGIVRERIECNKHPAATDGAAHVTQLDDLGWYMLQEIRSYLKVADILDDEEEDPERQNSPAREACRIKRKRLHSEH